MHFKDKEVVLYKPDRTICIIYQYKQYEGVDFYWLSNMYTGIVWHEVGSENFLKIENQRLAKILYWPGSQL